MFKRKFNRTRIDRNIEIIDDTTIKGSGEYPFVSGIYKLYFYIKVDKPYKKCGTWNNDVINFESQIETGTKIGAFLEYSTKKDEQIKVKVGISYISCEQAKINMENEIADWDFDRTVEKCRNAWNEICRTQ